MSVRIDPELGPVQICRDCQMEKPLSDEFWHKDNSRDEGFRTACKVCVNQSKHVGTDLGMQQTLTRLENAAMQLLDKICETPITPTTRLPHIADVAQATMNVFGGVDGFARQIGSTYFAAKPGSQIRQRILDSTARWVTKSCEMGMIERDLKNMTTEDLERLYRQRLREEVIEMAPKILEMSKDDGLSEPLADAS